MDLEGIILSEIKSDKDKSCMISFTCGMLKKEKKESCTPPPLQTYTKLTGKDQICHYQRCKLQLYNK